MDAGMIDIIAPVSTLSSSFVSNATGTNKSCAFSLYTA